MPNHFALLFVILSVASVILAIITEKDSIEISEGNLNLSIYETFDNKQNFRNFEEAIDSIWARRIYVSILVGTPSKEFNISIDTASNVTFCYFIEQWMILQGADCEECKGDQKYDDTESTTSRRNSSNVLMVIINYLEY